MDYLVIFILQFIGISLNVLQIVLVIDKQLPDDTLEEVFLKFWKSDRITVFISVTIMILHLVTHGVIAKYWPAVSEVSFNIPVLDISVPYIIASFLSAFFIGYFGQWLMYKLLGKMKDVIGNKIDSKQ